MREILASDIAEMTIEDRINMVEDIWDSIAIFPEKVTIPDWHKKELDKRLKEYHRNPDNSSPWTDVKKRILS